MRERLERHLKSWLGAWPPGAALVVVGSERRVEPGWNGEVFPVAGVAAPFGVVLSVAPEVADALGDLDDLDAIAARLPALVGRPHRRFARGVFRWSEDPAPLPHAGQWVDPGDERLLPWLRPFTTPVLVAFDDDGSPLAGVGRKQLDEIGQELAVVTEPAARGRGLARRLIAQTARRVLDEGGIPTYLHSPNNVASAHVADAAGFPDRGWQVLGLPTAS
jgi:GNAT superfamily N-acetyltransferase